MWLGLPVCLRTCPGREAVGTGRHPEGGPREAAPEPWPRARGDRSPGAPRWAGASSKRRLREPGFQGASGLPETAVRTCPCAAACRSGSKLRWGTRNGNFAQLPFAQVSVRVCWRRARSGTLAASPCLN